MSYPVKIKAVGIKESGGVELIQNLEVPFPEVKSTDLLIRVEWAGVNFIDILNRSGQIPVPQFPFPVASEVSGVILELPSDHSIVESSDFRSRGFKKGGRVALFHFGSLKEYVAVAWDAMVYAVPDNIPSRTAAAALVQGLTALTNATEAYNVQKGDTVFIHTIAGGVGQSLAQIAKARGATVIGTTSTLEKATLAKAHGAEHVILYKNENTVERALELTDGQGVNVIYDGVGQATFDDDLKMIKRKGTIVTFGSVSGLVEPVKLLRLSEKNVRLLNTAIFNYLVTLEEHNSYSVELWGLVSSGALRTNIHNEYPFTAEGVRQAHIDLTAGTTSGKLLIKVTN